MHFFFLLKLTKESQYYIDVIYGLIFYTMLFSHLITIHVVTLYASIYK